MGDTHSTAETEGLQSGSKESGRDLQGDRGDDTEESRQRETERKKQREKDRGDAKSGDDEDVRVRVGDRDIQSGREEQKKSTGNRKMG